MPTEQRTVSRNGQVAIPRRFLEALGIHPPAKVELLQEKGAVIIRRSSFTRLPDEEFLRLLKKIRHRNTQVSHEQVEASIRQARSAEAPGAASFSRSRRAR